MENYEIKSVNGDSLYQGYFSSFKHCLESAAAEGIKLFGADLRHKNLVNAELDDGLFKDARFDGANLMGANLSGANLNFCNFDNAALQNTCICESNVKSARFAGTHFGATDISGSDISYSLFDNLSALTLNFRDCNSLALCRYKNQDGQIISFSKPPLSIAQIDWPVIFFDTHLKVGPLLKPYKDWFTADSLFAYSLSANPHSPQAFFEKHRRSWLAFARDFVGYTETIDVHADKQIT